MIVNSENSEEVTECPSCLDGKLTGTAWTSYAKENKSARTFSDWLKTVGGIFCRRLKIEDELEEKHE